MDFIIQKSLKLVESGLVPDQAIRAAIRALSKKRLIQEGRYDPEQGAQRYMDVLNIVKIAEQCPEVSFWLPTREKGLINQYVRSFGDFPSNLTVRVSAAMVDSAAPAGFLNTSTVHKDRDAQGYECPAQKQGNKCQDCRACWSRDVHNVSYHQH